MDFKDCEYRFIGYDDELCCKNKEGYDLSCDNCMENYGMYNFCVENYYISIKKCSFFVSFYFAD